MRPIKRALLSVSDKTGITEFAKELHARGIEILSTGGTARAIEEAGVPVILISDYTGFPEILDGRVKTLNPKIHGGILGVRDNPEHVRVMEERGIDPIDLVVINLYPFEETIARPDVTLDEAIENIDIGGPAMVRSASKNYRFVTVLVDPDDYPAILKDMDENRGATTLPTRARLARDAFRHTYRYDGLIQEYLSSRLEGEVQTSKIETGERLPDRLNLVFERVATLRYGENPHQAAALYKKPGGAGIGIVSAEKLQGRELSYNNLVDLQAAFGLVREFDEPAAVIVKHSNPCGTATAGSLHTAFVNAREADPISAFGGILGFNREVGKDTAEEITKNFVEAVIAPGFSADALDIFSAKKNVRLLKLSLEAAQTAGMEIKNISGGLLVQDKDMASLDEGKLKVATSRQPTKEEWQAMRFAWKVVKHVKSNAIVYSDSRGTIGVGAGQMSRVDSARLAAVKANRPLKGSVMASDAFFPFRDAIDAAAEQGITAIIQPGGSIKDQEVINAANEHNIAMVFTGIRHFKH